MKNFKLAVFSIFFSLSLIAFSGISNAQGVNDFVINNFHAEYILTNEDPQGTLNVVEIIDINFSGQNRGILRAIPTKYKDNNLNVEVESVTKGSSPEPYITYSESGNLVLQIGNPDIYITGVHKYEIRYKVENVISFYNNQDELYWDINGDQWLQTFENVNATLRSEATQISEQKPACFTGGYNSTEQNCNVSQDTMKVDFKTTGSLVESETMTFVVAYEKGYFTPPSWVNRNFGLIVASPLILLQILIVYSAYKQWARYGKDYGSKIIAPYFERPKGLSVMQAGFVLDNNLSAKHLSASIVDLAIRRYITISENGEGKKAKHTLTLETLPDDYLQPDEKGLLNELFEKIKIGEKVEIESKKNKLYKTFTQIAMIINTNVVAKGYYETSPRDKYKKLLWQFIGMAVVALLSLMFAQFTNIVSVYTGVIMIVLVLLFHSLMTRRSVKGRIIVDHMKGLRLYLDKAEKDRIKMQDAVAAPLSKNFNQPVRDREFFEKLLPFAIAMGVEKTWAKAFSDLYKEPPEWYQGNWSTFNNAVLMSSIATTINTTGLAFTDPSSSSSSGFSSGGGFSGGGGGGGGGGGW